MIALQWTTVCPRDFETDDYWAGLNAACDRNRSAIWSYKSVKEVDKDTVRKYFLPFEDPRKEFKPIYSRPDEIMPDWKDLHDRFVDEYTTPAVRPRAFMEDGSMYFSRGRPFLSTLTQNEFFDIPCIKEMRLNVTSWIKLCEEIDYALRTPPHFNVVRLGKRFKEEIIHDCFREINKFCMGSPFLPAIYSELGISIMNTIQPIVRSARLAGDPLEWLPAAVDVVPLIAQELGKLKDLLFPVDEEDDLNLFQEEMQALSIEAYNRSLVEDIDYVSV